MKVIDMIRQEPVMFQALLQTAVALLAAFGLQLNPSQVGAVVAFSAAALSFWTRTQVTPTSNPMSNDGARLISEPARSAAIGNAVIAGK